MAKAKVTVSSNKMLALIYLPEKEDGDYTTAEIHDLLDEAGVVYGVLETTIKDIITFKRYNMNLEIARGKLPVTGRDGYYDLFFKTELDNKPVIKEDGSVDYKNVQLIEMVEKDQVVARYEPPLAGEDGIDVYGKTIVARKGAALAPLTGNGILRLSDEKTYIAATSGKIEMQGNKINIYPIYIVNGDLDLNTGNIDFNGDVIVHGNVCSMFSIKARGNIEISGLVENARIEAGGDVIIKGGMNGNKQGTVIAGGNLYGSFFEGANILCKGKISANYLYHCNTQADGDIVLDGKYNKIIGGKTVSRMLICAHEIGTIKGVETIVQVGTTEEILKDFATVSQAFNQADSEYGVLKAGLMKFEGVKNPNIELYRKVKTVFDMKEEERTRLLEKKQAISDEIVRMNYAKVVVTGEAFPKSVIISNLSKLRLDDIYENVTFKKRNDNVIAERNE